MKQQHWATVKITTRGGERRYVAHCRHCDEFIDKRSAQLSHRQLVAYNTRLEARLVADAHMVRTHPVGYCELPRREWSYCPGCSARDRLAKVMPVLDAIAES